jgi:hypothetical protein
MRFYRWRNTSGAFPREYDGTAFIAEHGSWNRAVKIGYRIMMLRVDNRTNAVTDYEPFASGWLQNEGMAEHNFTWGECVGQCVGGFVGFTVCRRYQHALYAAVGNG